ncbi:MAG: hypothetical protein ACXVQ7_01525 [Actinomycetota bacterium]
MDATLPEPPVILVAMPESDQRGALVGALTGRGDRVIICSAPWTGPGSCALMRDEPCALLSVADGAIVSATPPKPSAAGATTLCAITAHHSVLADGKTTAELITAIDDELASD